MGKYTTPKIYRGKTITSVPKGSSKKKEETKNDWYINYSYEGKQVRVKGDLNRIKDDKEKELEAEILLLSIKQDLANGFNPFKKHKWIETLKKDRTLLSEAIILFKEYNIEHNSRKKTIGTYLSKVKALSSFYPSKLLAEVTTKDLQNFIQTKIKDSTYSQGSVKNAKTIFSLFFNTCIKLELIKINPMTGFDKKIKSQKETKEQHVPFNEKDLKDILEYLDINDKYGAFFCRMIYYTCLRPSEIKGLKIANINLINNNITVPASVKKVTKNNKDEIISIDPSFKIHLENLKLDEYPIHFYLTGSSTNIVGENRVGINTPYNKLATALKKLNLKNKGYDLYSFKHTSNVKKYLNGWSLAEIMKANRHTSLQMTEVYLRNLTDFIDIKSKVIPPI